MPCSACLARVGLPNQARGFMGFERLVMGIYFGGSLFSMMGRILVDIRSTEAHDSKQRESSILTSLVDSWQ
jgi:hypothetical protein